MDRGSANAPSNKQKLIAKERDMIQKGPRASDQMIFRGSYHIGRGPTIKRLSWDPNQNGAKDAFPVIVEAFRKTMHGKKFSPTLTDSGVKYFGWNG